MNDDVRWTAKAPAMIAGLAAILGGLMVAARGWVIAGVIILALGLAFVAYSLTLKDWCQMRQSGWGGGAFGQSGFGGQLGQCLAQKGWLAL